MRPQQEPGSRHRRREKGGYTDGSWLVHIRFGVETGITVSQSLETLGRVRILAQVSVIWASQINS